MKKSKTTKFKLKKELTISDLLTLLVIIIAFSSLLIQRKDLITKVNDLNDIITRIENEKLEREVLGLNTETKILNSFTESMDYSSEQIQLINRSTDNEFMFLLKEINQILILLKQHSDLSEHEQRKIDLLLKRNISKAELLTHCSIYTGEIQKYSDIHSPKSDDYKTTELYLQAQAEYLTNFNNQVIVLKYLLDSLTSVPIKSIQETETEFINLELNKVQQATSYKQNAAN